MNNVKQFLDVYACGLQMIVYVQILDHIHHIEKVFGLKYNLKFLQYTMEQEHYKNGGQQYELGMANTDL